MHKKYLDLEIEANLDLYKWSTETTDLAFLD